MSIYITSKIINVECCAGNTLWMPPGVYTVSAGGVCLCSKCEFIFEQVNGLIEHNESCKKDVCFLCESKPSDYSSHMKKHNASTEKTGSWKGKYSCYSSDTQDHAHFLKEKGAREYYVKAAEDALRK